MIGTMGVGVDDQDNVIAYVPPKTSVVDHGNTITNGQYQIMPAGNQEAWEGVIQFANGSGQMTVVDGAQIRVRTVTITMP